MLDESRAVVLESQSIKKRLAKKMVHVARRVGFLHAYGSVRSRVVKQQVAIIAYHRIDRATNYPWSITPRSEPS